MQNVNTSMSLLSDNTLPDNATGLPSTDRADEQPNLIHADSPSLIPYVMVLCKRFTEAFFKMHGVPGAKKEMVVGNASHLRKTLPHLSAMADKGSQQNRKEYIKLLFSSEEEAQKEFSRALEICGEHFIDAFRVLPSDVTEIDRIYLYSRRINEIEQLFTCVLDDCAVIGKELDNLFPIGSHLANVDEMIGLEQNLQKYKFFVENRLTLLFQNIRFQRDTR